MGYRAHVQSKHEIEYNGNEHFNWANNAVMEWLEDNGVTVCGTDEYGCGDEWELSKVELKAIPESAFRDIETEDATLSGDNLRAFVKDLLDAPTGDYSYVSWF